MTVVSGSSRNRPTEVVRAASSSPSRLMKGPELRRTAPNASCLERTALPFRNREALLLGEDGVGPQLLSEPAGAEVDLSGSRCSKRHGPRPGPCPVYPSGRSIGRRSMRRIGHGDRAIRWWPLWVVHISIRRSVTLWNTKAARATRNRAGAPTPQIHSTMKSMSNARSAGSNAGSPPPF